MAVNWLKKKAEALILLVRSVKDRIKDRTFDSYFALFAPCPLCVLYQRRWSLIDRNAPKGISAQRQKKSGAICQPQQNSKGIQTRTLKTSTIECGLACILGQNKILRKPRRRGKNRPGLGGKCPCAAAWEMILDLKIYFADKQTLGLH